MGRARGRRAVGVGSVAGLLVGGIMAAQMAIGASPAAASGASWTNAAALPGLLALNAGGGSLPFAVACEPGGSCAAGGDYEDGSLHLQPFVASRTTKGWEATAVAGMSKLNTGGDAVARSVSCSSAGNCLAAGDYYATTTEQAFVVAETAGKWGSAEQLPGIATLENGGASAAEAVGCAAGSKLFCAVGGFYTDTLSGKQEAFVATVSGSTWVKAKALPGIASLSSSLPSGVTAVSCGAADSCAAVGNYSASSPYGHVPAYVDSLTAGSWGDSEELPGLSSTAPDGSAAIPALECTSAGNCVAGGETDQGSAVVPTAPSGTEAFLVTESSGDWGDLDSLSNVGTAGSGVFALSCVSNSVCEAGGEYETNSGADQYVFSVSRTSSGWGTPDDLTTLGDLDGFSCWSSGSCALLGTTGSTVSLDTSTGGVWATPEAVPGLSALTSRTNGQGVLSCGSDGGCSALGEYGYGSFDADQGVWASDLSSSAPAVTSVAPAGGPAKGGQVVTVRGGGFAGVKTVDFGTHAGTHLKVDSTSELTVTAPAGSGTVDVTVTTSTGHSAVVATDRYTYYQVPAVTSLSPDSGPPKGGTHVVIKGKNLVGATSVKFGTKPVTHFVSVTATEVEVVAPAGSGTVTVSVTTPGGTARGGTDARYRYT